MVFVRHVDGLGLRDLLVGDGRKVKLEARTLTTAPPLPLPPRLRKAKGKGANCFTRSLTW